MQNHLSELKGCAAFSIENFARAHGIGRTLAYELIKTGQLTARKVNNRTVVTTEEAQRWRESLPKVSTKAGRSSKREVI